jgi:hypothetical protein
MGFYSAGRGTLIAVFVAWQVVTFGIQGVSASTSISTLVVRMHL